jgi:hypothetical protein
MRKIVFLIVFVLVHKFGIAQFEVVKDSVVQIYGLALTADSLKGIRGAFVKIKDQNRGTITNNQGVFSIAALKGDVLVFTHVNYQGKEVTIPYNITGNQYSVIQMMIPDTNYTPTVIIKSRPSAEEFARDFVNKDVPDDEITLARKNLDETHRRVLSRVYAKDGREGVNSTLRGVADSYYSKGQAPSMRILSPTAWAEFIKSWKRGDFKRKKK